VKCRTGLHEWGSPLDAERCCSRRWERVMRPADDCDDLDREGRNYRSDMPFVYGWVPVNDDIKDEEG